MKNLNKGWLFWVWVGLITTPVLIECSHQESKPHLRTCGEIGPMRAKNTRRDTPPTVTPSWERPQVTSSSHWKYRNSSSHITLKKGTKYIKTGMTSEEILNQLSLDYQDLYDYYGGAEEIF